MASRKRKVDLRVELDKGVYEVGEPITGYMRIKTVGGSSHFSDASFLWQSVCEVDTVQRIVWAASQPIAELKNEALSDGCEIVVSINYKLPPEVPVSLERETPGLEGIIVETKLIILVNLSDPEGNIHQESTIKVVQRPGLAEKHGFLQTIEFGLYCFPPLWCCPLAGSVRAHIEVPRRIYTAGDIIHATLVIDTEKAAKEIKSVTMALRRTVIVNLRERSEGRDNGMVVDEYELYEGPPADTPIPCGTQTTLAVRTRLPEYPFVADTRCDMVSVRHSILILFKFGPFRRQVETEIPIKLVHPEAFH